ncbi:MAG: ribosome recycling factor [Tissierellia bacterium]|nr:ribosome recycling factor [Tissierellia bacterium]
MYEPIINELENKLKKTISALKDELTQIRAGRANPALVEKITVDYYGVPTPLQQVASISAPEARLLVIQPWDASIIKEIEKEIQKSDLGITPSNDGKLIRLPFPVLTEERRVELTKVAKKISENSKVSIRNLRRDAIDDIKKLEKEKSLPEDDRKVAENKVQEVIDKYNKMVEEILKAKEDELMEL